MDVSVEQDSLGRIWALWKAARPLHVVDVGANPIEGDAPYKGLLECGYCRVTGFEPQPEALAALNASKTDSETYLSCALGDGTSAELHLYRASGFASLFPALPAAAAMLGLGRATRSLGTQPLQTRRLDDLDDVGPVDFLKIDVQGSELAVIANGARKLAGAVAVQTEVRLTPIYDGEPGFGELDAELRRQGFMFHDFAFLKRMALASPHQAALKPRVQRQAVDGDALYIRDLTRPDGIDDDQLFRLALLADGVMQSPGLAVFCLDTLAARGRLDEADVADYLALLPPAMRRG